MLVRILLGLLVLLAISQAIPMKRNWLGGETQRGLFGFNDDPHPMFQGHGGLHSNFLYNSHFNGGDDW